MTLETIVPPLADCKRIPAGSFPDSALIWVKHYENGVFKWLVMERNKGRFHKEQFPAPPLSEILAELPYGTTVMLDAPNVWVCINRDKRINITKADNPATAALRLWERINNKEKV